MATLGDIGVAAGINILSALGFLLAFALLRLQPINDRVYFSKWYLRGLRTSPSYSGTSVRKFVNCDFKSYLRFLGWMCGALQMPELELVEHAGLDSAVYLRIYLIGIKIFVPVTFFAFAILVPVNWTGGFLETSKIQHSSIDKLSISNIKDGSPRNSAKSHRRTMERWWRAKASEGGASEVLGAKMERSLEAGALESAGAAGGYSGSGGSLKGNEVVLGIGGESRGRVEGGVHGEGDESGNALVKKVVYNANKLAKLVEEKKAKKNWLVYYQGKHERALSKRPTNKTGFCGLCGTRVDSIDYYTSEIEKISKDEEAERERIRKDPKSIMPAAFVSFRTRWGAAVCAQTQQSRNPTIWLTDWAPEPCDIYWPNLAIPVVYLTIRRLIVAVAFFFLTFFFIVPISFVQSLANIEYIEKVAPFLRPLIEQNTMKSLIQGFLPGIALKIFLILLPTILMMMSKFEGLVSLSSLERRSASKYYLFLLVNVFLVSIVAGSALQQLHTFIHQSANQIPITIGNAIPLKATFFITYVMVDGWAGIAGEILRLKPLIFYHLKNFFLVKTEEDREKAMDPGSIGFDTSEPQIQLYFLLGLVYAVVTPFLLPFIVVFFGFAYLVYRHQIINVYNQEYESGAAFWPDVHKRIIVALIISQILLLGLMSTKKSAQSAPLLLFLPILTIYFHKYCKSRYESAFVKYPLQEAMMKDTLERAKEPNLDLKGFLSKAYIHPLFKSDEEEDVDSDGECKELDNMLVPTKRQSRRNTPVPSKCHDSSAPLLLELAHSPQSRNP